MNENNMIHNSLNFEVISLTAMFVISLRTSRSWSRFDANLVSVSWKMEKVLLSVSSRTNFQTHQSRPGLERKALLVYIPVNYNMSRTNHLVVQPLKLSASLPLQGCETHFMAMSFAHHTFSRSSPRYNKCSEKSFWKKLVNVWWWKCCYHFRSIYLFSSHTDTRSLLTNCYTRRTGYPAVQY